MNQEPNPLVVNDAAKSCLTLACAAVYASNRLKGMSEKEAIAAGRLEAESFVDEVMAPFYAGNDRTLSIETVRRLADMLISTANFIKKRLPD